MTDTYTRSLVATLPIPAFVLDETGRVAAVNDKADGFVGTSILGRSYLTALRQPKVVATIEQCARSDTPAEQVFEVNGPQGEQRYKVSAAPFEDKQARFILVCFEDVSHLHNAGRMRRDFVANVSHELRTPLTAVIGFIETVLGPARDDDAARTRFLDLMLKEAQRMNRLVDDLLVLSRVEAAERVRPSEDVHVEEVIQSSISSLSGAATKAGVQVEFDAPGTPAKVQGDEDQLRQIFNNLLENAIKYGSSGGKVIVTISDPVRDTILRTQTRRITVQDFGKGIEAHHLPRLTERFYRVDTHRSREMGGTGLGLAIVKHILNRHRGRLQIDSVTGQGTEITAILPVA